MNPTPINKLIHQLSSSPSAHSSSQPHHPPGDSTLAHPRQHWRINGLTHDSLDCQRLPSTDLDNWQLHRINLSKRSYQYPRNYKGIKISGANRQFSKITDRGQNGQLPYLYKSDLPKIQHIREKLQTKPFLRTNTAKHEMFGFPKKVIPRAKSMLAHPK